MFIETHLKKKYCLISSHILDWCFSSESLLKLLKTNVQIQQAEMCSPEAGNTHTKSIVTITVRCEVTALKTNLCNLLKSFIKNWQTIIHKCGINGVKMGLFGTQANIWAAAAALCALFIFDPSPSRSAIKLSQKCKWHCCLVMGHLQRFWNHSGVQTSKSSIDHNMIRPIISLIAQGKKGVKRTCGN